MITFLGDAGLDHYLEFSQKRLGGCALNVATHFKRNSKQPAQLIYPSSLDDRSIEEHCARENIKAFPLRRNGQLPCQEISIATDGEKSFIKYHVGVLEGFKFTTSELEFIAALDGIIVAPLFSQILPFIDQVLTVNSKAQFFFDFHDCRDFDYDIKKVLPYLEKSSFAQFGLGSKAMHLKDFLLTSEKDVLITQGAGEVFYRNQSFKPKIVNHVKDSTGAGDAFLGAFLATGSLKQASIYTTRILQKIGSI